MATKNYSQLTARTTLAPDDVLPFWYTTSGVARKILSVEALASFLRPGDMINGKLSVTVSANDLIVALKTLAGGDPSATDPVIANINGTIRTCTAALSVTKADATNWCNSGGSELATKEVDYFVYLIWNTTPGTDIMDIGFSRIPYGRVYSDFSGTTTNEKYLAFANASTPTATDDVAVIGRFAATLSAGAAYTWTVPTFTNINLVQHPIFETRWLTWIPTYTGFSVVPVSPICEYKVIGNTLFFHANDGGNGTSNANTFTKTVPFFNQFTATIQGSTIFAVNNSVTLTGVGRWSLANGSNAVSIFTDMASAVWATSNNKRADIAGFYKLL